MAKHHNLSKSNHVRSSANRMDQYLNRRNYTVMCTRRVLSHLLLSLTLILSFIRAQAPTQALAKESAQAKMVSTRVKAAKIILTDSQLATTQSRRITINIRCLVTV